MNDIELIADVAGIARVALAVAAAPWTALSGESNAMHAYRERLCLLAVNAGGALFAVDLVALRGRPMPLRALEPLLQDPTRPLYVHGGEYLVAGLKRELRLAPAGIVDGQQAAVLLGRPQSGYRALVRDLLGVTLPAPLSIDWSARPLPPGAVAHAVEDVRHLPAVIATLMAAITAADLLDELAVAGREVGWTSAEVGHFEPDGFYRVKGAHQLGPDALRVLRTLWVWRDAKARALDLPPGRLISNELLVALSRRPADALDRLRHAHFHSRLVWGDQEELLQAVARSLDVPTALPERRETSPPAPGERERAQRLKTWRQAEATRRGVGLQAVLPAKSLRFLERHGVIEIDAIPGLGDRRRERYGEALIQLCAVDAASASR